VGELQAGFAGEQSNLPLLQVAFFKRRSRWIRALPKSWRPTGAAKKLFYTKAGQYNFSCASCHTSSGLLGQRFRGQVPTTPFGDAAHFPTYRLALGDIESLQQRFMRCNLQSRTKALPPGDPAYTDLEVFYTVLSNDYPVSVPSAR
jgi:sulfur-oxidizing protein SoxA